MAPLEPSVISWFASASRFLNRATFQCEAHHVQHTGKLARSIVLDLQLSWVTQNPAYWQQAVRRARHVSSRLAPDPEHGGFIYMPGRFDPRNCSNSVIDSGECTDALARLLLDERAAGLTNADRTSFWSAVEQNAETYLRHAVVEKEIVNQRLWGAMGLASAYRIEPRASWTEALQQSLARSIAEQRPDGSWGYQRDAARHGSYAGAADLTVYYHSRCLTFLLHVLDCLPESTIHGHTAAAVRRGLDFLAAVITPDGLKPLALEGKRWFWDGTYEAGSNAYDIYALLRGAERYGVRAWQGLAARCWDQLARHQSLDGGLQACAERRANDFVCRDFHTADLAWPAQVMRQLPAPGKGADRQRNAPGDERRKRGDERGETKDEEPGTGSAVHHADAGILRLEAEGVVALLRTSKQPGNTLYGGACGGGALVYVAQATNGANRLSIDREATLVEGSVTLYPARARRGDAIRRFWRDNPPGREGRQWLFVARLLVAQHRPVAAGSRLWRGYLRPLVQALRDPAASQWALAAEVAYGDGWARARCWPSRRDGSVPGWAARVSVTHEYWLERGVVCVAALILGTAHDEGRSAQTPAEGEIGRVVYRLPPTVGGTCVESSAPVRRLGPAGSCVELQPPGGPFSLRVTYQV